MDEPILAKKGLTKVSNFKTEILLSELAKHFPEAVMMHSMLYFNQRDELSSIDVFLQEGHDETSSNIYVTVRRELTEKTGAPMVSIVIKNGRDEERELVKTYILFFV